MTILSRSRRPDCLLICTADNIGGMERVVCSLSRQFTRRGLDVQTVFPHSDKSERLLGWCREQGVLAQASTTVLDAAAPHGAAGMMGLRNYVRAARPGVVNVHYGDNFISLKDVIAIRLAGRHRCVVTVHHPTAWEDTTSRKRRMTVLAARLADAVIAVSDATRLILEKAGVPRHRISVIPNGVPVPTSLPTCAEGRAKLGLPLNAYVVGTLGRLVEHKGIQDLITALARIKTNDSVVLAVAGDGPYRSELARRAATELPGRVIFLGSIQDASDLYAACDVFALPSRLEGFGLVYVEAALHGKPSIGTTAGAIPEVVEDGKTGILVPPGSVEQLATAVQTLQRDVDLRGRLGVAAKERASDRFTETAMAERYGALLGL